MTTTRYFVKNKQGTLQGWDMAQRDAIELAAKIRRKAKQTSNKVPSASAHPMTPEAIAKYEAQARELGLIPVAAAPSIAAPAPAVAAPAPTAQEGWMGAPGAVAAGVVVHLPLTTLGARAQRATGAAPAPVSEAGLEPDRLIELRPQPEAPGAPAPPPLPIDPADDICVREGCGHPRHGHPFGKNEDGTPNGDGSCVVCARELAEQVAATPANPSPTNPGDVEMPVKLVCSGFVLADDGAGDDDPMSDLTGSDDDLEEIIGRA